MTRLILDAHLSGRAIGRALQERVHDAHAIDAEKNLEGLKDEDVLELAISEDRVLITARTRSPDLSGTSGGLCASRAYRLAHDIAALELTPCLLSVSLQDERDGLTEALAALLEALSLSVGSW